MRRSCQHGAGVKGSDWVDIRQGTLRVCSRRSSLDKSTCGTTRNITGLMSAIQQRYDHPHRGDGSDRTWFWKRYKRSPSSLNCSPSSAIVFLRSANLLPARFFSSLASVPSNFLVNSFSKSFSSTTRKDMALPLLNSGRSGTFPPPCLPPTTPRTAQSSAGKALRLVL